MPMAHYIWPNAQIEVKVPQCGIRRRRSGEIMTDTAEGNPDEKCLISISHDRASYQSRGMNELNAPPRKVVQGSGTKPAKTNSSSE